MSHDPLWIQRHEYHWTGDDMEMRPSDDGEFVRYVDHCEVVDIAIERATLATEVRQVSADHDPLCPNTPEHWDGSILWPARCDCDLIARVRADERQQARQRFAHMLANTPVTITITPPIESVADAYRTALDAITAGGDA